MSKSRTRVVARLGAIALALTCSLPLMAASRDAQADSRRSYDAREALTVGKPDASLAADRAAAVEQLRAQVPDLRVTTDYRTGATRTITNATGFLTAPRAGDAVQIAREFLSDNLDLLGLSAADLADAELTHRIPSARSGITRVFFDQRHDGLPVYNGLLQVNVAADGRILTVNNLFVPHLAQALNTTSPVVGADEAVAALAAHLGTDSLTAQPAAEPQLRILPIRPGEARLVWNYNVDLGDHWYDVTVDAVDGKVWTRFDWVADASYRVYETPIEAPSFSTPPAPADGRTLAVDPQDSLASPFGWHDTNGAAGAEFTTTQGNNAHAYTDIDANNLPDAGSSPDGGGSLVFDFALDLTQAPSAYRPAAVTNLFYFNNVIHDVAYRFGFDEENGNFQENNYGRGGLGSDYVNAEAQDGTGVNNANFATPPDGSNPRMQMFIWTAPNPDRDGDLDNGIITHEYGHGISNRLVGPPSNVSCLQSYQQPGEGLSDWWAMYYTFQAGSPDVRGIGTYALNQPTTGPGIRGQLYDKASEPNSNSWTYESVRTSSGPHPIGEKWAQGYWYVTGRLEDEHGFDPDIYDETSGAGNIRAMEYIIEGLKQTVCSPSFTDVRDGIIAAATAMHGGEDVCLIWEAFADYGLGFSANDGNGTNANVVNGFDLPAACQGGQPNIDVDPTSLTSTQDPDTSVNLNLALGNDGGSDLDWTIAEAEPFGSASSAFTGDYDVSNWTLVNDPTTVGGSVDTTDAPNSVAVTGGNAGEGGTTDFQITVPASGTLSFDWAYASTDSDDWDSGGYAVNGAYTQLADNASQGSGSASVFVTAGQLFALRVATVDGSAGAGVLTISTFEFAPATGCDAPQDVPWLSVAPTAGTTGAGATSNITVTLNSTGLAEGTYEAMLCIESNDPDPGPGNGTERVVVPVELVVEQGAGGGEYCATVGTNVPDNTPAGLNSSIVVTDSGTLADIDVQVTATHSWVGDYIIRLTHVETATSVTFYDRPGVPASTFGCSGDNLPGVFGDDEGTDGAFENDCLNATPAFTPDGHYTGNNPLSAFDGEDLSGTWTLNISDNALGDTGALTEWCLVAELGGPAPEPDIEVDPTSLGSTQAPDTTSTQTLTVSNVGGGVLDWEVLDQLRLIPQSIVARSSSVPSALGGRSAAPSWLNSQPFTGVAEIVRNEYRNVGSLTFYSDRAVFQTDNPGLTAEDYSGHHAPANSVTTCTSPINSQSNDACFTPGAIVDGLSLFAIPELGLGEAVLLTPPFFGVPCTAVGANTFGDHTNWEFDPPVAAVGFDLLSNGPAMNFTLTVFGPSGQLGSTDVVGNGPSSPVFFGVQDAGGAISRIEVRGAGELGELFCSVEFGGGAGGSCDLPSWASVDPDNGSVNAGDSMDVDVTFDSTGLAPGTYEGTLCLSSNDATTPVVTVPLTLTVEATTAPDIEVDPTTLSSTQGPDEQVNLNLDIDNVGDADLEWEIVEEAAPAVHPHSWFGELNTNRPDTDAPAYRLDAPRGTRSLTLPVTFGTPIVGDGGFETGTPNAAWTEAEITFGTPICDIPACGAGGGTGPHSGDWWTWFGGINAVTSGYVQQNVTIPAGTATLTFWLEIPVFDNPGDLSVRLGGTPDTPGSGTEVFHADETTTGFMPYALVTVDVSAFAGGTHLLSFESESQAGAGVINFFIDDVAIEVEVGGCANPADVDWLSVAPLSGTTLPGATSPVTVTLDSALLAPGTYEAQLCIESNDPDEPLVLVPVSMTVEETDTMPFLDGFESGDTSEWSVTQG